MVTDQFLPSEFQITFLMPCKFKCHLPLFSTGFPNACDKRRRNITMLHHIVKTVQKKLHKRDIYTANRSWKDSRKTRLEIRPGQGCFYSVNKAPYVMSRIKKIYTYICSWPSAKPEGKSCCYYLHLLVQIHCLPKQLMWITTKFWCIP